MPAYRPAPRATDLPEFRQILLDRAETGVENRTHRFKQNHPVLRRNLQQPRQFMTVRGDRLFAQNMLAVRKHPRGLPEVHAVRTRDVDRVDAGIFRKRVEIRVNRLRPVTRGELPRFFRAPRIDRRVVQFRAAPGGFQHPAGHEIRADRRKTYHERVLSLFPLFH